MGLGRWPKGSGAPRNYFIPPGLVTSCISTHRVSFMRCIWLDKDTLRCLARFRFPSWKLRLCSIDMQRPLVSTARTLGWGSAHSAPRPCSRPGTRLLLLLPSRWQQTPYSWAPSFPGGRAGSQTPMSRGMSSTCKMRINQTLRATWE